MSRVQSTIALYEGYIENLQWHLETNGWSLSETDKKIINQRISDFTDFISTLKSI